MSVSREIYSNDGGMDCTAYELTLTHAFIVLYTRNVDDTNAHINSGV